MSADKRISEILGEYGEAWQESVWKVQGTPVIYHKALERIATKASISFDVPTIIRAERDEAVLLVVGRRGERVEWSIGEALIGANYRVSGKQAAYVYAIAEKRAKDRVILKLVELHGLLYSEEEADDFKNSRPDEQPLSRDQQVELMENADQRMEAKARERSAVIKRPQSHEESTQTFIRPAPAIEHVLSEEDEATVLKMLRFAMGKAQTLPALKEWASSEKVKANVGTLSAFGANLFREEYRAKVKELEALQRVKVVQAG